MAYWNKTIFKTAAGMIFPLLIACQTSPPAPSEALPSRTGTAAATIPIIMPDQAKVVYLNNNRSHIDLHIFRSGSMARLGHNHVISLPAKGLVKLHPQLQHMGFQLVFAVSEFVIDDERRRAEAGPDFSQPVTKKDIEGTRQNLITEQLLDADNYPFISIRSLRIWGKPPLLNAEMAVTIKEITRNLETQFLLSAKGDHYEISGELQISQQQFGITPFSILGGAISVRDRIKVRYHLSIPH